MWCNRGWTKRWAAEISFMGSSIYRARGPEQSLFGFVDTTDTLGINTNINWAHRFSTHLFFYASYKFSRLRTRVTPEFEGHENIAGAAGISGDDQDPADWGPPSLGFSSGIFGLSDGNSLFNRNRTDGFQDRLRFIEAITTSLWAGISASRSSTIFSNRTREARLHLRARPPLAVQPAAGQTLRIFCLAFPTPARLRSAMRINIFVSRYTMFTRTTTGGSCRTSPSMRECAGTMARR